MSDVVSVLLKPIPDGDNPDPHGLLKHGPLNAHPPEAMQQEDGTWGECGYQWWMIRPRPCALVLARNGEPVPAGCWVATASLPDNDMPPMFPTYTMDEVDMLAEVCVQNDLATLILLDSEDREIPHV